MKRLNSKEMRLLKTYCPTIDLNNVYQYNPINNEDKKSLNFAQTYFKITTDFKLFSDSIHYYVLYDSVVFTIPIIDNNCEESFDSFYFDFYFNKQKEHWQHNSFSDSISKSLKTNLISTYFSLHKKIGKHTLLKFFHHLLNINIIDSITYSHLFVDAPVIILGDFKITLEIFTEIKTNIVYVYSTIEHSTFSFHKKDNYNTSCDITEFDFYTLFSDFLTHLGIICNGKSFKENHKQFINIFQMVNL